MRFWNFVKNKKPESNEEDIELRISGEIIADDDSWIYDWFNIDHSAPNAFRKELKEHVNKDITVWIDSPGGSLFAGASIYNALKEHKGKVTVKIDSQAMSAASIIAMAGDEILMSPVAVMMIHNPWVYTAGDMHELRKTADILDVLKDTMMNAYINKTGKTSAELSKMLDDETWMSPKVAQKEGFIDGILDQNGGSSVNNMAFSRAQIMNSAKASLDRFFELFKAHEAETDPNPEHNNEKLKIAKAKLELELII